ncbi:NAD(P)/FAD-dependent oxidoreductase [Persicobacter sp. CCB-QB2]|uniref:NAD(P)/FAD-dependent oxidoreductase n=1 Tax=Persicobacter sp. CCB-QB2 TaxID=1561025 RepID=UPI0006A9A3DB|nr:NAD(P)/FAD-dependent oxidoreductase [Persicobacter sp. CCB-QB2]
MGRRIVIIGGGAAGFFAAANLQQLPNDVEVVILEKSNKTLSKVKVSGGGRCNVTTSVDQVGQLVKQYPRGEKPLRNLFKAFGPVELRQWFEERGIPLKTEDDGRVFPTSDSSQTIIDCLREEAQRLGVKVMHGEQVVDLSQKPEGWTVTTSGGKLWEADLVMVAMGGHPKSAAYDWLSALGLELEKPLPSLFTFNIPNSPLLTLAGTSVPSAELKIAGTKFSYTGPLLITHWGLSGPAVLKLSAFAARHLAEKDYQFQVLVKWDQEWNEDAVRNWVSENRNSQAKKKIVNCPLRPLTQRLWSNLMELAGIPEEMRWADLPKKSANKLINAMVSMPFEVAGKTTFKEEFVTAGGVKCSEVDFKSMQSRKLAGLYLAGEVLDVDGITGGYNFQNAWSGGYVAARHMVEQLKN